MNNPNNSNIHRYLDDAFAEVPRTPEIQDLKEEIRGNLAARAIELQEQGLDAAAAAASAVEELGDIRELIASLDGDDQRTSARPSGNEESVAESFRRNRVRPKPGFVIRIVLLSLLLAAGAVTIALAGLQLLPWPTAILIALSVLAIAAPVGLILFDGLRQETSQNFALPTARSIGYGAAGALSSLGIALAVLYLRDLDAVGLLVAAILSTLLGAVGFIWLGATQTNRKKPWVLAMERSHQFEDRFSQDPVAAARFGVYTVVIWVLAIAAFAALSATIGFGWSWLALVLGLAVFMFTLARMLFPANAGGER